MTEFLKSYGGSLVAKSCSTLGTPWTIACQAPLSMGFSRQAYWNGLQFPPLGDLPDIGMKPLSPALAGRFSITEPPGKPNSEDSRALKKAHLVCTSHSGHHSHSVFVL